MSKNIKIRENDAVRLAYYLMAVDGHISECEEEYLEEVAKGFGVKDFSILEETRKDVKEILELTSELKIIYNLIERSVSRLIEKMENKENYNLYASITEYKLSINDTEDNKSTLEFLSVNDITPNILLWNLMTMAIKDLEYSENESMLIKYIAGKFNVDETVLVEMDNAIRALYAVKNDLNWIKDNVKDQSEFSNLKRGLLNRMITIEDGIKLFINEEM